MELDLGCRSGTGMDDAEPLPEGAGTITIETPGGVLKFFYPNTLNMKNLVMEVLRGEAYPVYILPGYSPAVILDVGANVGAAAVYFYLHYPSAQIHCFEPSGRSTPYLRKNTRSLKGVHVHPYGLFDKALTAPIFGGKDMPAQDSIGTSPEACHEIERVRLEKASDEVARLSIGRISILKVDTEGCEIPILRDLLQPAVPVDIVYAEYHSEDDRLDMDRMLSGSHYLLRARADAIHRGTLLYISRELALRYELTGGEILPPFRGCSIDGV